MPYIDHEKVDQATRERLDSLLEQSHAVYWKRKRVFDLALTILFLLILWPFLLLIAIIICIDDPSAGPIYKQKRIGRHGKPFYMYKFRTMYADADKIRHTLEKDNEMDGPVFKMKNDPASQDAERSFANCHSTNSHSCSMYWKAQ